MIREIQRFFSLFRFNLSRNGWGFLRVQPAESGMLVFPGSNRREGEKSLLRVTSLAVFAKRRVIRGDSPLFGLA